MKEIFANPLEFEYYNHHLAEKKAQLQLKQQISSGGNNNTNNNNNNNKNNVNTSNNQIQVILKRPSIFQGLGSNHYNIISFALICRNYQIIPQLIQMALEESKIKVLAKKKK